MRKALLLTGSLGMGHDVVAEACATSLAAYGWSTETLDAMRLRGRGGASVGEAVFRGMLAVPGLFDAVHFSALRTGSRLALLADAAARRRVVPRLRAFLDENPADLAISVFATGASAVSRLADRYPAMSHVVFCTDVTPHRLWVHQHVDLYHVTSPPALAREGAGGQGRDNLQQELELGDAGVPSRRPADLVRSALAALDQIKPVRAGPTRWLADGEIAFSSAREMIGP